MNRLIIFIFLTSSSFLWMIGDIRAQDKEVHFKFEVDGKPARQKFKVQLDIDGRTVKAKLSKNGFYVPLELQDCKNCDVFAVRFISKRYVLAFDGVYRKDLNSSWIVGVDNRPFDEDNTNTSTMDENIEMLHYLGFRPKDDEIATRLVVSYPKKKKPV